MTTVYPLFFPFFFFFFPHFFLFGLFSLFSIGRNDAWISLMSFAKLSFRRYPPQKFLSCIISLTPSTSDITAAAASEGRGNPHVANRANTLASSTRNTEASLRKYHNEASDFKNEV
jgi:hypothetical protein